jgi:glyoxylase-like metal-dependent hydrolase (beta-lactamase superfamily II)
MKFLLLLAVVTSVLFSYELKLVKINSTTYCFIGDTAPVNKENGGFVSNICLVKSDADIIAIDSGPTYEFARQLDEKAVQLFHHRITKVVLANYHDDRVIGASYFQKHNIPIYAEKSISEVIAQNDVRFQRIQREVGEKLYQNSFIPTVFTLIDTKFDLNKNIEIRKLSSASNSSTDLIVYDKRSKTLFVGNIVFNDRALGYFPDSNVNGWLEAIDTIKTLKATAIVGGHGKPFDSKSYLTTEKYLQAMKQQIPALYDQDVGLEKVVEKCDFSEFRNLSHFQELNGKNIYNYYMQVERE